MTVHPGERVLDIGCGAGVVGLAAAMRGEGISVHAMDSNIRAVECALLGAELNGLDGVTGQADADGNVADPGTFDVVVGNRRTSLSTGSPRSSCRRPFVPCVPADAPTW